MITLFIYTDSYVPPLGTRYCCTCPNIFIRHGFPCPTSSETLSRRLAAPGCGQSSRVAQYSSTVVPGKTSG